MYSEGGSVVKANNETAFNYFRRAADKVRESDTELGLVLASFQFLSHFLVALISRLVALIIMLH